MKRFLITLSFIVLFSIIIFLFESILSGTFCHCSKVYCPSTKDQQLQPKLS